VEFCLPAVEMDRHLTRVGQGMQPSPRASPGMASIVSSLCHEQVAKCPLWL
jgi:hypothetical protein